jgi:hypothetical protein
MWRTNSVEILDAVKPTEVINVLPSVKDGSRLASIDLICIHPEFDEVADGEPIPIYGCYFGSGRDGKFARGPLGRLDL